MINNKILIVDDEPDICDLVSDILSESGYSVKSAFSKNEAIKVPNPIFSLEISYAFISLMTETLSISNSLMFFSKIFITSLKD